jgi:hypothetical protein
MGRREHERVTIIGSFASREVAFIENLPSTILASGQFLEVDIFSPKDTVSKVLGMQLAYGAFTSGATGTKRVLVLHGNNKVGVTYAVGNANTLLQYTHGEWTGTTEVFPSDKSAQYVAQSHAVFDDVNPLRIRFENNGSIWDKDIVKRIYLWVERERVV